MQPTLMFDFKEGGLVLFLHSEYKAALSTKIRLFPWGWKVLVVIFGKTELVYINTSKADSVFSSVRASKILPNLQTVLTARLLKN